MRPPLLDISGTDLQRKQPLLIVANPAGHIVFSTYNRDRARTEADRIAGGVYQLPSVHDARILPGRALFAVVPWWRARHPRAS